MKDIVLRETSFHIGECRFPKDCEVDRLQIKFNIFESYILKKYTNKQHKDYNVKWCLGIENIQTYIKEHWFLTINYFNQHNNYSGITLPLKNNHFIMFNSDLNYCFEKNKTEDVNTIHTTLYRLL
jgi:hypothetical protein